MCFINEIKSFVSNGVETLRKASKGHYDLRTDELKEIRREVFDVSSSRADDIAKLRQDKENISHDVRVSFNKLVLDNG